MLSIDNLLSDENNKNYDDCSVQIWSIDNSGSKPEKLIKSISKQIVYGIASGLLDTHNIPRKISKILNCEDSWLDYSVRQRTFKIAKYASVAATAAGYYYLEQHNMGYLLSIPVFTNLLGFAVRLINYEPPL